MKNIFKQIIKILLLFLTLGVNLEAARRWNEEQIGRFMRQLDQGAINMGNDINRNLRQAAEDVNRIDQLILAEQQNGNNPEVIRVLERQRQERQAAAQNVNNLLNAGAQVGIGAMNMIVGVVGEELRAEQRQREILTQSLVNNRGSMDRLKELLAQLKDPQNIMKAIALVGGATLATVIAYYGVKLTYEQIKARMGKPDLVRESSRASMLSGIKEFMISLFGEELRPKLNLEDVILAPEIEAKVHILAEDILQTANYGLPYQNIVLEGPPGTGKSMLARILALRSGMDYAILSGADFRQFKDGEDITKLHELFAWAKISKKGLIIFIDEADACLRDRATLDKDGVNLVNAFLSQTGEGSDKFMLILATNYADELDAAVRSRIHKKIHMGLPALEERIRILKNKIDKYIISDERTYVKDDEEITSSLTLDAQIDDEYITKMAEKIDGFSGRDIEQMIAEMRLRAYRSGENIVTPEIFEAIVNDKNREINQDKKITAFQKERLNKREGISSPSIAV